MQVDLTHIMTWIGTLVGLIGVWFRSQYKTERLEEKAVENARQIEALWNWKEKHDKESSDTREQFNKEISKLEGSLLVTNEQFKQIMQILNEIKDRIDRLENKRHES